jgi:uncharacterized protein
MPTTDVLPTRTLGRTGEPVTILGIGTGVLGFGRVPDEVALGVMNRAFDLGIRYFDTAHHYASESLVGRALEGRRDQVWITTKTAKRNYKMAWSDIRQSLRDLRTDHIDLLLMHCVNTVADLDAILNSDGSVKAAIEAQQQGLVRHIGLSGHSRPNVLAMALERFPFDAVMPALGAIDAVTTGPDLCLMPVARRAAAGVIAMKVVGNGYLAPLLESAVLYPLDLGAHVAVVGMKTISDVEQAVAAARNVHPLSQTERSALMALATQAVNNREKIPYWLNDAEVIAAKPGWIGANHLVEAR